LLVKVSGGNFGLLLFVFIIIKVFAMWWGLVVDGELSKVRWIGPNYRPTIWDFDYGFISSQSEYEIVVVEVSIRS